jgi:hypothetical protein
MGGRRARGVEGWLRGGGVPGKVVLEDYDEGPEPKLAKMKPSPMPSRSCVAAIAN